MATVISHPRRRGPISRSRRFVRRLFHRPGAMRIAAVICVLLLALAVGIAFGGVQGGAFNGVQGGG